MKLMHTLAGASLAAFATLATDGAAASTQPDPNAAAPKDPPKDPPPASEPKKVKGAHIVWAAPGSDEFRIGGLYLVPADMAESLRAAGRARPASDEEVKAAKKAGTEIPALYGA